MRADKKAPSQRGRERQNAHLAGLLVRHPHVSSGLWQLRGVDDRAIGRRNRSVRPLTRVSATADGWCRARRARRAAGSGAAAWAGAVACICAAKVCAALRSRIVPCPTGPAEAAAAGAGAGAAGAAAGALASRIRVLPKLLTGICVPLSCGCLRAMTDDASQSRGRVPNHRESARIAVARRYPSDRLRTTAAGAIRSAHTHSWSAALSLPSMSSAVDLVDAAALARDVSRIVRVPSITGGERAAAAELVAIAREHDLEAQLVEYDLEALRAAPGYPGEEAPRTELVAAIVTLRGHDPQAPRLALNGHLDVVAPGTETWRRDPWSGAIEDGVVHGRGSVDMKGGVVAALHALAALRASGATLPGDVVLHAISLGGGRRPRDVRRARARRPLRGVPDPRADGARDRLRARRSADVHRHRPRPHRARGPAARRRVGDRPLHADPRRPA